MLVFDYGMDKSPSKATLSVVPRLLIGRDLKRWVCVLSSSMFP